MSDASVDIVMPARNAAKHIGDALASLQAQTLSAWRLFIVDDGSTDETHEFVLRQSDARIECLRTPGLGAPSARNEGLKKVSSPFVLFLDADDMLEADALLRMSAALDDDPDAVLAYGRESLISADGLPFCRGKTGKFSRYPSGDVLSVVLSRNFIPTTGAALIRTEDVRKAGGFNQGLPAAQDWELWCRLALRGPFSFVSGAPVVRYRIHAAAMSANLSPDCYIPSSQAVFGNPVFRDRFSPNELQSLRRLHEAHDYYNSAKEAVRQRDWRAARSWAMESIQRNPSNARAWIIGACAGLNWAPAAVWRRLGARNLE